jgi:hypothetical protein
MDLEQQKQPNKYIEYIKANKYNVYFAGAIVLLLIVIIGMIMLIMRPNSKKSSIITTTKISPTQIHSQISPTTVAPSSESQPINKFVITPDPTQAAVIETQTQPQITPGGVPFTYTDINIIDNNWATANISNQSVGGGAIILQKVNGSWKVIAGPGTLFPPDYLQSLGVPQDVIDSFNTTSPSPAVSQ